MKDKLILESKKIKLKRNRTLFDKAKISISVSNIDHFPNPYIHIMWYDKKNKLVEHLLSFIDLEMTPKSHVKDIVFNDNDKSLTFIHNFIDDSNKEYNVKYTIHFNVKKEYEVVKTEIMNALGEARTKFTIIGNRRTYIFHAGKFRI